MMKPSPAQTAAYQAAFDHFNERLFGGALPPVILNFSRKAKTYGFFAPERWRPPTEADQLYAEGFFAHSRWRPPADETDVAVHEISLNPAHLKTRPLAESMSTLVHEMVHLWQQVYGKPSRGGYHNREWAAKMRDVGLEPTGLGTRVSHSIVVGGEFSRAMEGCPTLPFLCSEPDVKKAAAKRKTVYECCGQKTWGKPGLRLVCGLCGEPLEEETG